MEKIQVTGDIKAINNGVLVIQTNQPVNLTDGNYEITIKDIPKKRSLRQNRYLWALIGEIAQREDGDLRNQETLYTHLLEMSDLIDTTLRYAAELGIYTPYWEQLLKC